MWKYYCLYVLTVYVLRAGAAQNSPGGCVLPGYPPHGTYTVYDKPGAVPGQVYDLAILTVACDPGYGVVGSNRTYCFSGNLWQQPMPQCTRFCKLTPDPSVKYFCRVAGEGILSGTRECHELEPHGTVVVPECNRPVYYSSSVLLNMRCVDGTWDHVTVCQPDCGTCTPMANELIISGTTTKHGELPWHAGVYDKAFTPYKQICGGSLISTRVIISAAHCFWKAARREKASTYAVALGKIYRPWDEAKDQGVHKSNVSEIKTPVRYLGEAGHYQEDIALVFMSTPVVYCTYIRPVCIDFSEEFDSNQLQNSNLGKVSGWGLTSADGGASPVLLTAELPYVDVNSCMADLSHEFKPYLTSDKFCAGDKNGTTVCKGDSGGGLAFPSVERGIRRYYLRGVVSTAPRTEHKCNVNSYATFTHIQFHATFIKDHGLGVASTLEGNHTRKTAPPDHDEMKRRVAPDGCPYMAPGSTTEPTGIKAWDKCLEYQMRLVYPCEESKTLMGDKVRRDYCRHNAGELIAGGTDAKRGEFPHMVLLGSGENISAAVWGCGGTLISDRFILTSAQCMFSGYVKYAIVGSLRRTDNVEPWQVHRIRRIFRHPGSNFLTDLNDIALLETDTIQLKPSIVPACLDVFGGDHDRAIATGWGIPAFGENIADTLQKVTLAKFSDGECSDLYRSNNGYAFNSSTQVCYGDRYNIADTCLGDSGGPLTILNHRLHCMYTVVGIIPSDVNCGTTRKPIWYTKVSYYVPWIESIVWP